MNVAFELGLFKVACPGHFGLGDPHTEKRRRYGVRQRGEGESMGEQEGVISLYFLFKLSTWGKICCDWDVVQGSYIV